jgi:prepilin-type N-terminal cleavage/methylation domain-containing protein
MQPKNNRQLKTDRAFTLIELLVVIAIVGILAGLAVVNMSGATERARIVKAQNFAASIQHSMATSLAGEWNFDGQNANDSSGNNNNGTINGAVATTTVPSGNGAAGQYAMSFDGVDDYIDMGNIDAPVEGKNDFTVSFWLKPNIINVGNYRAVMGTHKGSGYNLGWNITTNVSHGGDIGFIADDVAGSPWGIAYTVEANMLQDQWNCLTISRSGNIFQWYKNGSAIGSGSSNGLTIGNGFYNLQLGNSGQERYFKGLIDDVRIYSAALTASAIREQYLAGLDKLLASNQITEKDYQQRISKLNLTYAANE